MDIGVTIKDEDFKDRRTPLRSYEKFSSDFGSSDGEKNTLDKEVTDGPGR